MDKHVALYCRISKDRSGLKQGVKNQEALGRAYAAQNWPGLPVVVYLDNDISASKDAERPAFERLRATIARGEVAHVWAVEQARLDRREKSWFRFAEELDAAGIAEVHTKNDGIIEVRSEIAGFKAVIAAQYARRISTQVRNRLDANATRGIPWGANPFGYRHAEAANRDRTYLIVQHEADAINRAADLILDGWSLTAVAKTLNAEFGGLLGPTRRKVLDAGGEVVTEDGRAQEDGGKPKTREVHISARSIRSWFTRSRAIAGRLVSRGVDAGPGNWPAIIELERWEAVRDALSSARVVRMAPRQDGKPGREQYPVSGVPRPRVTRKYLLTGGISVCGNSECRSPLSASVRQTYRQGVRAADLAYYYCNKARGGCGGIGIKAEEFEQEVVRQFFAELAKPDFAASMKSDPFAVRRADLATELERIKRNRRRYNEQADEDLIDEDELLQHLRELRERERPLQAELRSLPVAGGDNDFDWSEMQIGWDEMPLDVQRKRLSRAIELVTVWPADRDKARRFDPTRISVAWRGLSRKAA